MMNHHIFAQILRKLLEDYGEALLDDPQRCETLLKEHWGPRSTKREIHVLVSALREGIPTKLQALSADLSYEVQASRLAQNLHEELGFVPELAIWAVHTWALAVGLIPASEIPETLCSNSSPQAAAVAADSSQLPPSSEEGERVRVITVASDGSGDYPTIHKALQNASAGARICLQPGVYRESLTLDQPVELVGHGEPGQVTVETVDGSCLRLRTDYALIRGIVFHSRHSGTHEAKHFAVDIETGRPVLEDCDIRSDSAAGVAIHGAAARPTLRRCRIHDCRENGVFVYDYAQGLIEDCEIFANALAGVAIEHGGHPILRRCQIHDGYETGIYVWDKGKGLLEDCEIFGNTLAGVAIEQGAYLTLRRCQIHDSRECGVYLWDHGQGLLEDCEIFANVLAGITVTEGSDPRIRRCRIHDGQSAGIEIWERGEGLVEDSEIFANATMGILIHPQGQLAVRGCRINRNRRYGLRIETEGYVVVEDSDLSQNAFGAWKIADGCRLKSINNREK